MTIPTTLGFALARASFKAAGLKISPHGRSTRVTRAPARSATSTIRPPKTPLTHITIESPGSIRLTTVASMPALPVALTAMVMRFCVRITVRSICCMPFINSR